MKKWIILAALCALSISLWALLVVRHGVDQKEDQTLAAIESPLELQNSPELAAAKIESAKVAQDYVQLIDQGRYAESWQRGARLFQGTVSQKQWVAALTLARRRLGQVKSRTLKDQRPAWDPRGLPKGAYMVVEYNTSFTRAPQSGELLTLMQEPNGEWKVLTYHVN